jgi:hypothetical protein
MSAPITTGTVMICLIPNNKRIPVFRGGSDEESHKTGYGDTVGDEFCRW